jgi:hypothetical protein
MTTRIISFRTRHAITPGHTAVLAEILSRDDCRCSHCRAPGGARVLYGFMGPREVYVLLDSLEAFDAVSGEAMDVVPAETIPVGMSSRIVLDVAFIDHNPSNGGKRGRRPNVVALCQGCAKRHDDEALFRRWAR